MVILTKVKVGTSKKVISLFLPHKLVDTAHDAKYS